MAVSMVMTVLVVIYVFGDMKPLENLRNVTFLLLPIWHIPRNFAHSPSRSQIPEASPCTPPLPGLLLLCSPPVLSGAPVENASTRVLKIIRVCISTQRMTCLWFANFYSMSRIPSCPPNKSICGAPYVKVRREELLL